MKQKKSWPSEIPRIGGMPEQPVLLIYDIEDDRLRTKLADLCKDFGLERIQYSAFFGQLSRNHREELALRCEQLLEDK
ncbi:CRISPR-associated endonuclease Cas2, partial [bacterium]|nr:CRISPR-associated endonuclease Cas2 [bacterium]